MLKIIIQLLPKKIPDFLNFPFRVAMKNQQEKNHSDRMDMDHDGEDRFEDFDERERNWR